MASAILVAAGDNPERVYNFYGTFSSTDTSVNQNPATSGIYNNAGTLVSPPR